MKKILAIAIGTAIALGTVSFAFAQDTTSTSSKKMSKKKKKTDNTDKK